MVNTTLDAATVLVAKLVAAFPNSTPTVETRALWVEQVRSVSESTARAAIATLIAEQTRWPTIAHFKKAVERHQAATIDRAPRHALPAGRCEECDGTGWAFTTPPGEPSVGDCVKCSRGCLPPAPSVRLTSADRPANRDDGLAYVASARAMLRATKAAS